MGENVTWDDMQAFLRVRFKKKEILSFRQRAQK